MPPPARLQVREQERRAEEQRQAKAAADEEWRRAQREREMQRKAEEEAREREAKVGWAGAAGAHWLQHRSRAPASRQHTPGGRPIIALPIRPPTRPLAASQAQDIERYQREMELMRREQEEEKQRRAEAYER